MKQEIFNSYLDKLAHIQIQVYNRRWSAFQVCGYTGFALSIFLAIILMAYCGLSLWVLFGLTIAAVLTFFSLVMGTKVITGKERIIYYHHEIAVMLISAFVLLLLKQPILLYLDVTILGIGVFLTCGRIGCLMVGCCHGKPYYWGISYRQEYAEAGFTSYYVGVRLFPIQAVESLYVLCIVIVGTIFVLSGRPPGTALAWYVVTYDLGRFCFEFLRGDPERPYYWGFSQPQWISLIFMLFVVWAELAGILPFQFWHIGATTLVLSMIIFVALKRRLGKSIKHKLLHPHHVREVANALQLVSKLVVEIGSVAHQNSNPKEIHVACTFLGIKISKSKIKNGFNNFQHYALSSENAIMTEETVKILADLILQLKHPSQPHELIQGNRGVFHLLIHQSASTMPLTSGVIAV